MPRLPRRGLGKLVTLAVLTFSAIWSCSNSDKEKIQAAGLSEGCTLNSDCKDPLVCTFTRCHDECKTDRDCPGEQRCVKGEQGLVCQLKVETDCSKNAAVCQGAQVCGVDGECRDRCVVNADCTSEQTCAVSGQCASNLVTKDVIDPAGNILPDPFVDPDLGSPSNGTGGRSVVGGTGPVGGTGVGATTSSGGASYGVAGYSNGAYAGGTSSPATTTPLGTGGNTSGGAAATGGITSGGASTSLTGSAGAVSCTGNWGDCDANHSDCETNLTLVTSCGACNVACDPAHGAVKCDAATLKCVINTEAGGCNAGYADCNANGNDGCEANLATDPNNCGVCARSCGGGTCSNSQCGAAIVFDPTGATTLGYSYSAPVFLMDSVLVKLNASSGTEIRTSTLPPTNPVSQGSPLVTSSTAVYAMDVDTTNVYYSIAGSPATILYKPLNGAPNTAAKIAVNMPDSNYARALTSNGTAFYIVGYASSGYQILTAAKTLTAASTAAPLAGVTARAAISDLAVVGGNLYWIESPNLVYSVPLGGGTPVALDSTTQSGYYTYMDLASDGSYVYWNTYNGASSRIRRIAAAGSQASESVLDVTIGVNSPNAGIAVDNTHVYFYQSYQIYRVAKDGSTAVEPLANVNAAPYFYNLFAVDAGFVYGTGSSGQIVRVAKGVPTS